MPWRTRREPRERAATRVPVLRLLVREVSLHKIQESKTNPHTNYDEGALAELAANIKDHGVLQPVLLRPRPNGASESDELVVGSRRYRVSNLARRETVLACTPSNARSKPIRYVVVEKGSKYVVYDLDQEDIAESCNETGLDVADVAEEAAKLIWPASRHEFVSIKLRAPSGALQRPMRG